jgi:hypothetical protein
METADILLQLVQLSPVVAVLIWTIYYFKGELKAKGDEVKELHQQLRDNSREMILAITKMTEAVTDLREVIKEKLK